MYLARTKERARLESPKSNRLDVMAVGSGDSLKLE